MKVVGIGLGLGGGGSFGLWVIFVAKLRKDENFDNRTWCGRNITEHNMTPAVILI